LEEKTMSNIDTTEEEVADDPNADIKQMRARSKRTEDAEAENTVLKKKMAFMEAGVDVTNPDAQFLIDGWTGELDPAEIAKTAERMGLLTSSPEGGGEEAEPSSPDPEISESEREGAAASADLGVAVVSDLEQPEEDAYDSAMSLAERALTDGAKFEDALAIALNSVVSSAHEGDPNVIIDPNAGVQVVDG
jgi:hypothetical protein